MIGYLKGTVIHTEGPAAVIDVGGVGYRVSTAAALHEGSTAKLWIHTVVREDALDLYGFPERSDLDLFEKLISVSGIGPKTALGILTAAGAETLAQAVAEEKASVLTGIAGIGKKNAEKIIIELRGKIAPPETRSQNLEADQDALAALSALGYGSKEAREALREVPGDIASASDRVKAALQLLSKRS
jgi:Holliday junction DNA helicase RuvA